MRHWVLPLLSMLVVAGTARAKPPAYSVTSKIALPDGGWDLVSFDPALRRVYLARSEGVTAIDVETGAVTGKLAPANGGHAAVPSRTGAEVLVTNGKSNTADIVDARTGARLASIPVGEKPDAAMIEPTTGLGVVMNAKSGSLSLIDMKARQVVGTIPIGGSLELGAADGTGRIFVNVEDRNELVAVDLKARKIQARFALTGCDGPTGVAWLPVSRRVLSTCGNGVAAVTDPATGKVETVPIGQGPDTALYDPDRKVAFVPAGRSGELDVFDDTPQGVKPAGTIPTQRGARTGALDPRSGRIYLPAAAYTAPADAGARPQIVPGSVVLLVVSPGK
jgi:YVTN family beta-propeller protein